MNNNMENNVPVNNPTPAKSNSTMIVTILVIVVVALAAYLVYDKVIKKEENTDSKDSGEVLSDEEALKIGNELYNYANGNYEMDSELIKWATPDGQHPSDDVEPVVLDENETVGYEITNYDEIMGHFAKECKRVCWDYTDSKDEGREQTCGKYLPFVTKDGKHYAIDEFAGGNIEIAYLGDLKVKDKNSNKITFTIDYAYCHIDDDEKTAIYYDSLEGFEQYKNKCIVQRDGDFTGEVLDPTVFTKDFVIVKEDGNWKILKYYNDNVSPCGA